MRLNLPHGLFGRHVFWKTIRSCKSNNGFSAFGWLRLPEWVLVCLQSIFQAELFKSFNRAIREHSASVSTHDWPCLYRIPNLIKTSIINQVRTATDADAKVWTQYSPFNGVSCFATWHPSSIPTLPVSRSVPHITIIPHKNCSSWSRTWLDD